MSSGLSGNPYTDQQNGNPNGSNMRSLKKSGKETIDSNDKSFSYISVDIGAIQQEQEDFKKMIPRDQFMHSPEKRCPITGGRETNEEQSV